MEQRIPNEFKTALQDMAMRNGVDVRRFWWLKKKRKGKEKKTERRDKYSVLLTLCACLPRTEQPVHWTGSPPSSMTTSAYAAFGPSDDDVMVKLI